MYTVFVVLGMVDLRIVVQVNVTFGIVALKTVIEKFSYYIVMVAVGMGVIGN